MGGLLEDDLSQLTTWCHGNGAKILPSSHIHILTVAPHGDKRPLPYVYTFIPGL